MPHTREEMNTVLGMTEEELDQLCVQFENGNYAIDGEPEWTEFGSAEYNFNQKHLNKEYFVVSDDELETIRQMAKKSKISLAQFYRNAILKSAGLL